MDKAERNFLILKAVHNKVEIERQLRHWPDNDVDEQSPMLPLVTITNSYQ